MDSHLNARVCVPHAQAFRPPALKIAHEKSSPLSDVCAERSILQNTTHFLSDRHELLAMDV